MDTTDPDIQFDQYGNCSNCNNWHLKYRNVRYTKNESEAKWKQYVEHIKLNSLGNKYNCIVGISGGVDSSYVAYLCKLQGLRPLLVHMDNGWDTEIAVSNINKVARSLELDYVSCVLDWEEFRDIQLAFLKASSVDLEMPTDIAIVASIYKIARVNNIKYIISGGNITSEGMLPLQWGYHRYKDLRYYKYIVQNYSKTKIKEVPSIGILKESAYRFIYGMKTLYILNYHDYNKDKAKKLLIEELGWKDYGGKHHESRITSFWHGYAMFEKFGMDYRRPTLSSQICSGHVLRDEALEILRSCPYSEDKIIEDKKYISKKLNMSVGELENYLKKPGRTYVDFPNNKPLIDFCYSIYNKYLNNKRV